MTDDQRPIQAQYGAIGGLRLVGLRGGTAVSAPARAGFAERFRREAAEAAGETLTDQELERRAAFLLRSHMHALALRSAKARRRSGVVR